MRAHNCQHVKSHRIERGDLRLKIPRPRQSPEHYCRECAEKILTRDINRLQDLLDTLDTPTHV